ncbi:hypothetical protein B0J18DRAFT_458607 [Chaetomium sp. MPI-SDFR-AT-0129]|nr:hypothetical protein B0J18DRAFT_458607 [Chaetomium sp. MPI-SDFR-AT-0129]
MILPYHLVKVCGDAVFIAKGSDIHAFTSNFQHVSTWKYPVQQPIVESKAPSTETPESPAQDGPPTKRRRVEPKKDKASNGHQTETKNGQPKSKKAAQYDVPANERPFVQGLYATEDGRHLVAITGSDKTIWVFEHSGGGNIKLLSQRAMPKRPCSLTFTRDNLTILAADKFGDVYALPLVPSSTPTAETTPDPIATGTPTTTQPPSRSETPSTPNPSAFRPQADALTVHTKRNLKALENQKISLGRRALQEQLNRPQFELTLLLGHVSMLTYIAVGTAPSTAAEGKTREYIITADRDEHIRVSRGMPQAHVIEGFCLGHEDFVSRLSVAPGGREGVLISGGGDDDLFVWDWVGSRLLSKAAVFEHVKKFPGSEKLTKIAVTRILACEWDDGVGVFVTVEHITAIFFYELRPDNTLAYLETIPVPGYPLDIDVLNAQGTATKEPRLVVPLYLKSDIANSSVITISRYGEDRWKWGPIEDMPVGDDVNISETELGKIFFSTETLRKLSDFD